MTKRQMEIFIDQLSSDSSNYATGVCIDAEDMETFMDFITDCFEPCETQIAATIQGEGYIFIEWDELIKAGVIE